MNNKSQTILKSPFRVSGQLKNCVFMNNTSRKMPKDTSAGMKFATRNQDNMTEGHNNISVTLKKLTNSTKKKSIQESGSEKCRNVQRVNFVHVSAMAEARVIDCNG